MKLVSIHIHNFRSIGDADLRITDYLLLVGANNSGKSTIIDAIRAFYEHEKYKFQQGRDYPARQLGDDTESWIEMGYQLPDDEVADLPEKYRLDEGRLRLKKWFHGAPDDRKVGIIYGYDTGGNLSDDSLFGLTKVQRGRLGQLIYVPAVSKVDEHTKLSGPSALKNTLDELLGAVVADSPAYQEFRTQFEAFSQTMRNAPTEDGRSLQGFEKALSLQLSSWGVGFKLKFQPPAAQDITKNLIDWDITNATGDSFNQAMDQFGSGFQRHFIASLIRTRASFSTPAKKPAKRQFSPNMTLVLFEEPEAYLHPPQQAALSNDLRRIASDEGWQVIASTHSPCFVSRRADDLPSLVRLRSEADISKRYQISKNDLEDILQAREELETILGHTNLPEDDRISLERIRHFMWLDNDRCTLFFSDLVLLVEGATEQALFNRMLDDGHIAVCAGACTVLHSEGKYNTVRFMRLLNAVGLPYLVVYDEDCSAKHVALNELIETEAESAELCCGTVVLAPDLERFLGWPQHPGNRAALKPGHAMMNYDKGINATKVSELATLIQEFVQKV